MMCSQAGLNMMNLSTLNSFFSGRDESWFYLITGRPASQLNPASEPCKQTHLYIHSS